MKPTTSTMPTMERNSLPISPPLKIRVAPQAVMPIMAIAEAMGPEKALLIFTR